MRISTYALLTVGLAYAKGPNILFVLTDDQDLHMESVDHMQYLKSDIVEKGTTFTQHYCTVALCCPSRATLWTGKAAHNHNVTYVAPPYGGYPKVVETGVNDDYLFLWMQEAGYNTYYAGKLWNFHSVTNYNQPFARGFNSSDFLLDPYTYQYWNSQISHNGQLPVSYAGNYSTDVIAEKAYSLLDEALTHQEPWFLTVAPVAPHSNWVLDEKTNTSYLSAPQSAYRHEYLFHDYKIPRSKSFNSLIDGAASWPGQLRELNESVILYNDYYQQQRLRALQAVDEMLHELVLKLEAAGVIEHTFIFYSTDNGYHISQHRMHPGKECGYDTDIHIPMFIRGPGLKAGSEMEAVTAHTDVAPTILKLAGVDKQLDGEVMPLNDEMQPCGRIEHAAIEYWGRAAPEGHYGLRSDENREAGQASGYYSNNTYRGLRMVGGDFSLYYSVWCTGEKELYDLKNDPDQTVNLLSATDGAQIEASQFQIAARPTSFVVDRLDALIMAMKHCTGKACSRPWGELHPDGDVVSLQDALSEQYDAFYAAQPKMYFDGCVTEEAFFKEMESNELVHRYPQMNGTNVTAGVQKKLG